MVKLGKLASINQPIYELYSYMIGGREVDKVNAAIGRELDALLAVADRTKLVKAEYDRLLKLSYDHPDEIWMKHCPDWYANNHCSYGDECRKWHLDQA